MALSRWGRSGWERGPDGGGPGEGGREWWLRNGSCSQVHGHRLEWHVHDKNHSQGPGGATWRRRATGCGGDKTWRSSARETLRSSARSGRHVCNACRAFPKGSSLSAVPCVSFSACSLRGHGRPFFVQFKNASGGGRTSQGWSGL